MASSAEAQRRPSAGRGRRVTSSTPAAIVAVSASAPRIGSAVHSQEPDQDFQPPVRTAGTSLSLQLSSQRSPLITNDRKQCEALDERPNDNEHYRDTRMQPTETTHAAGHGPMTLDGHPGTVCRRRDRSYRN